MNLKTSKDELKGKVGVVTAAGRGLGKAIALELASKGCAVLVNSATEKNSSRTESEIRKAGGTAIHKAGDVSDPSFCKSLINLAVSEFGSLDILVNNAGITVIHPAEDFPEKEWEKTMNTNLSSAFYCSKAAAQVMIRKGYGRIINISSAAGITPFPLRLAYCTSKAALIMMTKAMAIEWAKHGITVNAVAPGWVETEGVKERIAKGYYSKNPIVKRSPMGRMGSPSEIAKLVAFIASGDSSYMTGETIVIDGGWTAYGYL
ncbi:MAG: 3-oxoacyl-ACP reductase FabG [Nitrososphaerota archaeon]|nr:3-oxoacyl-ACP reductase FabG [Nitrososphaerota archaeon]